MQGQQDTDHHEWWVPSLYLLEGGYFALISMVIPIFYQQLGYNNTEVAMYSSLLCLPWAMKCFFAPLTENWLSKKVHLVRFPFYIASLYFVLGLAVRYSCSMLIASLLLILTAIAGALYDINADGFYLTSLNTQSQARWVGLRTLFYQLGRLINQSGFLYLISLMSLVISTSLAWSNSFMLLSIFLCALAIVNKRLLPATPQKSYPSTTYIQKPLLIYPAVWKMIKNLPHLSSIVLFILFFQFPQAQIMKILPLFFLDNTQHGGLALSMSSVSVIYGFINIISMLVGATIGGFILNHYSLKKCLVPFTSIMAFSYFSYVYLAWDSQSNLWVISFCVAIAEFCFGLCNSAYMYFLLRTFSKHEFSMSLYAVGTTLMQLGMLLASSISGYLQSQLGYVNFFIFAALTSILSLYLAYHQSRYIYE